MPARILTILACALFASSCGSNQRPVSTPLPLASDLQVEPEPAIPDAALGTGPEAEAAEDAWNDDVLLWGRAGWAQVGRLCRWAKGHGSPVECPAGD